MQDALAEIASERDRRLAAEVEARRQRDEAERRHPVEEEPRRAAAADRDDAFARERGHDRRARPSPWSPQHPQKSRKWVWAVVGVLAVGVAASAVTVGVIETQPSPAHAGSLGLLDGRR